MPGRPKGIQKYGGRVAGTPNKRTVEFRQTVSKLLEDNAANVALWLKQVAEGTGELKPDPAKALDLMAKLAEYAAPKLNRTEVSHSNADGTNLSTTIVIAGVAPNLGE